MQQLVLILHVLVAIAIIFLVLMQHGRGADVGASFGSGSSNTMFGSSGALPFLMKLTIVCAAIFFATSVGLSYMAAKTTTQTQIISIPKTPVKSVVPTSFAPTVPLEEKK